MLANTPYPLASLMPGGMTRQRGPYFSPFQTLVALRLASQVDQGRLCSSGYDVSLTRRGSPARSWPGVLLFALQSLCLWKVFVQRAPLARPPICSSNWDVGPWRRVRKCTKRAMERCQKSWPQHVIVFATRPQAFSRVTAPAPLAFLSAGGWLQTAAEN